MLAKLLVVVLAMHMATCSTTFIKEQPVQATISTPTWISMPTPTPTSMKTPPLARFTPLPLEIIGSYPDLYCPDSVHDELIIRKKDVYNLKDYCKLIAKSIIIEDSIIRVDGRTLHLIADDVKILRT
ncbi:uncharacterized protein LOC123270757 [Cotesia glomerata]|nr:uncharacterized protein LOC123270757 [Cotesia glomerata]